MSISLYFLFFIHCASFLILLGRKEKKLCVCCLGPALIYRSVLTLILTSFFPFLAQYTLSWSFTCSFYWFLTSILAQIYYAYYNRHREEREIQELLGQLDAATHGRDLSSVLSFLCMLFLLRTSSGHFASLYSMTLLITNQTFFRVPEISLKSKDKKETKQELEKRKNTLSDNDLGKQKEIQKANFYIFNTQEILH